MVDSQIRAVAGGPARRAAMRRSTSRVVAAQAPAPTRPPCPRGKSLSQPYIVALMTSSSSSRPNAGPGIGTAGIPSAVRESSLPGYRSRSCRSGPLGGEKRGSRLHERRGPRGDGYRGWTEHAPFDAAWDGRARGINSLLDQPRLRGMVIRSGDSSRSSKVSPRAGRADHEKDIIRAVRP